MLCYDCLHPLRSTRFPVGQWTSASRIVVVLLLLASAAGCSSRPKNVARSVTGKVTLGGQPLAGASVGFIPLEGGNPAAGMTDESGNYKLIWGRSGRQIIE